MQFFTRAAVALFAVLLLSPAFLRGIEPQPGFTMRATIDRYKGDTDEHSTEEWLIAVRGNGDRVMKQISVDGEPAEVRVLIEPSVQKRITIDPETSSITSFLMTGDEAAGILPNRKKNCGASPDAETKEIKGVKAVLKVSNEAAGALQKDEDQWVAPSLGCEAVAYTTVTRRASEVVERAVMTPISISPGTPDRSLFEIPSNFMERAPSEVFALKAKLHGADCKECGSKMAARLDEDYKNRSAGSQ